MPGKYSHTVVLAEYSSQGLISLPNNKEIQYFRHDQQPQTASPPRTRHRHHSSGTSELTTDHGASRRPGKAVGRELRTHTAATPIFNTRRALITDSDTEEELAAKRVQLVDSQPARPQTPVHQTTYQSHQRSDKPVEHLSTRLKQERSPTGDPPELSQYPRTKPRRSGGVKALIEARYNEELAAALRRDTVHLEPISPRPRTATGAKAFIQARYMEETAALNRESDAGSRANTANKMSLHEFLDTVPRSPRSPRSTAKPQPRGPQRARETHVKQQQDQSISVQEFLSQVPAPPEDRTEQHLPPPAKSMQPSPPVSRLPKGVETQHEWSVARPASGTGRTALGVGNSVHTPPDSISSPRVSASDSTPIPITAQNSIKQQRTRSRSSQLRVPNRDFSDSDHELNFDGFADVDNSYFPPTMPLIQMKESEHSQHLQRTSSRRSWSRSSTSGVFTARERPMSSSGSVIRPPTRQNLTASIGAHDEILARSIRTDRARRSLDSPKASLTTASSRTSPMLPSPNANKGGFRTEPNCGVARVPSSSGSWGLPVIASPKETEGDLSDFFNAEVHKDDGNILIFTSDEEDEADEDDEDDLPTPRPAKLDENVQIATAQWGQISSGRQVDFQRKEADTMSELSAVYPPDIGRYTSSGGQGGPLEMALSGMRHGGELGVTYRPERVLFSRRSVNPAEFLQKLGLRSPPLGSGRSGRSGKSSSSTESRGTNQKYHPSASSRSRLPKDI